jgi:molybdate transport system regulatory protein
MAKEFYIRSKIWIEDGEQNVVFGLGRYRMLLAVKEHRSLQAAAKELKMSYRALWGRIKASEERLGKALVERDGRGSRLTPYALNLLEQYQELHGSVCDSSDRIFAKTLQGPLKE